MSLAAGEAPRLTEQIKGLRRSMAQEMGFVLPSLRIQDNLELPPDTYVLRVKEIEAARGQLKPPMHLAIDTAGCVPAMAGFLFGAGAPVARQPPGAARGPNGYEPLITLSAEWEMAFAEALVGPPEERQLAMAPSRLQEFMERVRDRFDAAAAAGESPALVCSGGVRGHVRAIVERFRPATAVLAQAEIHPRARIRTVGSV